MLDRNLTPRDVAMLMIGAMIGVAFFSVTIAAILIVVWWSV